MTISAAEYRAMTEKPKRSKYGNKRVLLDGITFDSKAEANYYAALKLRERAGEVSGIELQRAFPIIVGGVRVGEYLSDFAFIDHRQDDRLRVIDVKGCDTPLSRFKRKCVEAFYQIKVEVVK